MRSAIFHGQVNHCRYIPSKHSFSYPITMYYICLDELDIIAKNCKIISIDKFNLLSFKRKNYITTGTLSIINTVKHKIIEHGFQYESTNIFMLTHLSYLGYCYNPVTFYYCYNTAGDVLEYILAEINNTPWNERYTYVLNCIGTKNKFSFEKKFHISPFMPMNLHYKWFLNKPNDKINIIMQSFENQNLYFNATMSLNSEPLTNLSSLKAFIKYPFMTQKVIFNIYWHAFQLWFKSIKFYPHPRIKHE